MDELQEHLRQLHAAGASEAEMAAYVREYDAAHPPSNAGEPPEVEPGWGTKALGTAASLITDIPGASALAAGAASALSHVPGGREPITYRQARNEINEAKDSAPTAARWGARLIGGAASAAALPIKSAAIAGGVYGGLSGALSDNPDLSAGERVANTAIGAGTGALAGKVAEGVGTGARAKFGARGPAPPARPAPVKASPPPNEPLSLDDKLNGLLAKARAQGPASEAAGNTLDAAPAPDLESLLQQSIEAKGGTPMGSSSVVPKSNAALREAEARKILPEIRQARTSKATKERAGILDAIKQKPAVGGGVVRPLGLPVIPYPTSPALAEAFRAGPRLRGLDAELGTPASPFATIGRGVITSRGTLTR